MLYFDYAASAPLRPVARDALIQAAEAGGNAASLHRRGRQAEARVERARRQVAELLGRSPRDVIWTSGGTEANNLALCGVAAADPRGRREIVVSAIEHQAVLAPARSLAEAGYRLHVLPVDADGVVAPERLAAVLGPETLLVSVMAVNNEMGALQPIEALARLAHAHGAYFHTDAVQAAGAIDLTGGPADLITLSAHKLGGPIGVGALVVRPGVPLAPILHGAGHEHGLRPGTLNAPGIAAFGAAAAEAAAKREHEALRLGALRDRLRAGILAGLPWAKALGRPDALAPHIAAFVLRGLDGEALVTQLDLAGLAASSGAACSAIASEPSHVLPELGLDAAEVAGSLRLSIGWATTPDEVDEAVRVVCQVAVMLKNLRPMAI